MAERIMRRLPVQTLGILLLSFVAACSTDDTLPEIAVNADVDAVQEARRVGGLLAQYKHPRGAENQGLVVHAQFLDVRGVRLDSALESLEAWMPDFGLEVSSCKLRIPERYNPGSSAGQIRLDLLDLGPIRIDGPTQTTALQARRLPDLLSAFSGVVYGTEQLPGVREKKLFYFPSASYRFSAPGLGPTGGFSVELIGPEPLQILEVSRQDMRNANLASLSTHTDIELSWNAAAAHGNDDIFIDISTGFGPDRPRLQCRAADDGYFKIPSNALDALLDETLTLEVAMRRVTSSKVEIAGLDSSEFMMATADEITVSFR